MAKYSKRKSDGRYVANRTINGKRKVFYGKTCKEVDEKIAAYLLQGEQGRLFKEVAEEWRAQQLETGSRSAISSYAAPYKRVLKEFGPVRMGALTTRMIQKYIWEFAAMGYAGNTVNTELSVIRNICNHARKAGEIESSPVPGVELPKHLPKAKRPALTAEQEAKVRAFKDGDLALLGQFLIWTGMRRGELMALTWQDIDLKEGVIHVNKKINYSGSNIGVLEPFLKSKHGLRDVVILDPLLPFIHKDRIGLIFSMEDGRHLSQKALKTLWGRYCEAAGLMGDDGKPEVTPHQFRHTFATICYEAGIDTKSCAEWMGDSEAVVQQIYQELRPKKKAEGKAKVNAYLAAAEG